MTREEIIQAISNDKMMPYIEPYQLSEIVDFVIKNYKPSLPSNLDEAAERIVVSLVPTFGQKYEDGSYVQGTRDYFSRDELIGLVKAGAEWMAGQGATIEDEVCELYDKLYLYYIDDCSSMTPDTSCGMLKELGASKGDKVVVQIRKK